MADPGALASLEQRLAARNQALDARIGSQLASAQGQPHASGEEPLARAVADALQHLLKTAEVDEADWQDGAAQETAGAGEGVASLDAAAEEPGREALPPAAELRLYKARVRALYSDLAKLQAQAKEKDKRLDGLEKELRQLQAEKGTWAKQQKALESQAEKLRQAAEEAKGRLLEKENALRELGRDRQAAVQDRRAAESEAKARESRLSHALGELERYRRLLEAAKAAQQGGGGGGGGADVPREEYNRVVAESKRLEQQKAELASAFKKAMKLVDVLKRQKLHLEAAALLDVSGRELMQAMDLGGK